MKFDLYFEISAFPSQKSLAEAEPITIKEALMQIKDGEYADVIEALRCSDSKEESDEIKRELLPSFAFHARFNGRRKKSNIEELSGIVIVDIDKVDDAESVRGKVSEMDCVLAAMISPSGNGVKVLYLVDENIITVDNYKQVGSEVAKRFEKFGKIDVLSATDCLIATADKDIFINEDALIDSFIVVKEYAKEKENIEKRDTSKALFEDPEDFFETVLFDAIYEKAGNNFEFIRQSVFELAKFGFKGDYDLDFILNYTYSHSSKNSTRLRESIETAANIEQSRWPYDFREPTETLGGFGKEKVKTAKEVVKDIMDKEIREESLDELDLLIDYSDIHERFFKVLDAGDKVGLEISLSNFAENFRFDWGLTTVTGISTSGKTEMIDQICVDLARLYGVKTCVVGFEQTEEENIVKLTRKVLGFDVRQKGADRSEAKNACDFVTKYIKHINMSKVGCDLDKILEAFEILATRFGFKNFVIDPFNHLQMKSRSLSHEKDMAMLIKMAAFAKEHRISLLLIAHPTKLKEDEKTGKFPMPTLMNVKGTSAFYDASHHGLCVHREDDKVIVKVLKVKQNNLGTQWTESYFKYAKGSGRFVPIDKNGEEIDSDWKEKNWHLTSKYKIN